MADFVLVPGGWLGAWVWQDVASELTRRGHRAIPITLTGLGDRRHLARPDVGVGTHVEDVLQVIDHEEVSDAVLVGHSYGIFPVVGAADRRPERVGRVVHLDTGVPQDGDTVAGTFMDEARRTAVQELVTARGDGWRYPPQPTDRPEWWGSLAGLDDAARARLERLAAPHPYKCFTEPVELSGAVRGIPSTGVFCTGSGVSVAMVEAAYAAGDPRLAALADAGVSLFELATGHYPMLSVPLPLAEVLIEAAAGGGRRLGGDA
ncbi:alpha/beta fold hydrolase [Streptomyces bambusae]|uniref:Alpha/beta fold hydrolase n=1 Tax=Streptomyces bambusae TaxID=1550616 RepID=A0ABS6Z5B0_9ACTN|nr:alpha/beta hydrolase [Streptomyces bambusae]MBW5482746.1 alpha/beta fold hydrolase [Streptomyces bambusae]